MMELVGYLGEHRTLAAMRTLSLMAPASMQLRASAEQFVKLQSQNGFSSLEISCRESQAYDPRDKNID
jgi:hypothetical protein